MHATSAARLEGSSIAVATASLMPSFPASSVLLRRLFAVKCAKCSENFKKNDFVMRARNKVYHPDCFSCDACSRPLVSGDEFALRDDQLFCKVCTPIRCRATADEGTQAEVMEKGLFLQELSPTAAGVGGSSSISPLSSSNSSSTGSTSKLRLTGKPAARLRVRDPVCVHISAY